MGSPWRPVPRPKCAIESPSIVPISIAGPAPDRSAYPHRSPPMFPRPIARFLLLSLAAAFLASIETPDAKAQAPTKFQMVLASDSQFPWTPVQDGPSCMNGGTLSDDAASAKSEVLN